MISVYPIHTWSGVTVTLDMGHTTAKVTRIRPLPDHPLSLNLNF